MVPVTSITLLQDVNEQAIQSPQLDLVPAPPSDVRDLVEGRNGLPLVSHKTCMEGGVARSRKSLPVAQVYPYPYANCDVNIGETEEQQKQL